MLMNWAKATGLAAMFAVALSASLHWGLYYPSPRSFECSGNPQEASQQSAGNAQSHPSNGNENSAVEKIAPKLPRTIRLNCITTAEDQKSADDSALIWFTGALAVATIALVVATVGLVFLSYQQAADTRIIQRAYVRMSHGPPGLDVKGTTGLIYVTMMIKNSGSTPAMVTDIFFKPIVVPHLTPLPTTPDYSGDRTAFPKAFLVAQDEFAIFHVLKIEAEKIIDVKDFGADLYIVGFVDYTDTFGVAHRGGYARKYAIGQDDRGSFASDEAFAKRNNLIFVTQAGYNYDSVRSRWEN
jgi:hypothetical protein